VDPGVGAGGGRPTEVRGRRQAAVPHVWTAAGCLGLGRRQGTKGGMAIEGQEKAGVCLGLVPGGEDKVGLGRPPP
jgi:hypothetical protein